MHVHGFLGLTHASADSMILLFQVHLAQSLLRGLAEGLDLHEWLCSAIWPLEAAFQGADGYIAAKLTIAEMLKSGTTTFLEPMSTHTTGLENVVRAVDESKPALQHDIHGLVVVVVICCCCCC